MQTCAAFLTYDPLNGYRPPGSTLTLAHRAALLWIQAAAPQGRRAHTLPPPRSSRPQRGWHRLRATAGLCPATSTLDGAGTDEARACGRGESWQAHYCCNRVVCLVRGYSSSALATAPAPAPALDRLVWSGTRQQQRHASGAEPARTAKAPVRFSRKRLGSTRQGGRPKGSARGPPVQGAWRVQPAAGAVRLLPGYTTPPALPVGARAAGGALRRAGMLAGSKGRGSAWRSARGAAPAHRGAPGQPLETP